MREKGDFLVETEGQCFFCLNKISRAVTLSNGNMEAEIGHSTTTEFPNSPVYSLQYFTRYLRMDMTRVFSTHEPISPELLAKVEKAKLKVELCEECASQTERFSELCKQLEKIKMEIGFYVKLIRGKLMAVETDRMSRSTQSGSDFLSKLPGKQEVVNALRNEAKKKCNAKLADTIAPRVKVQNKTKWQLNLERRKIKSKRRGDLFKNTRTSVLAFESPDSPDLKWDPINSPSNSLTNDDGNNSDDAPDLDDGPTISAARLHAANRKLTIVTPSKIIDEVGTPKSRLNPKTGKYKCEICSKEMSTQWNFLKHYRSVHLKIRYKCSLCSKEFTDPSNHRKHLKSDHLGIRFKCQVCSSTFTTHASLRRHLGGSNCREGRENHI